MKYRVIKLSKRFKLIYLLEISNYSVIISIIFTSFLGSILYLNKEYSFKDNKHILFAILTITLILLIDKIENLSLQNDLLGGSLIVFFQGVRCSFIFPVFIYLFLYNLVKNGKRTFNVFLFLPFIFFTVLSTVFNLHSEAELEATRIEFNYLYWFENITLLIFSSCLLYKITKIIKEEKKKNTLKINGYWLSQIKWFSYSLTLLFICFNCYKLIFDFKVEWFLFLLKLSTSIYFFWLCVRGISELRITEERNEINLKLKNEVPASRVKEDFTVKNNHSDDEPEYLKKINKLLEIEKLYRETDLSREFMAEKLGISPGYLSGIINSNYQQNFSTLINSYRVNEALSILSDPEFSKYSIVSIAYEVGFNSKSAFYNAFKKETGTTPSVYLSNTEQKLMQMETSD